MSRAQRDKGNRGEREAAGCLSGLLGIAVQRELGQTRDGGYDLRVGPICVEVKRHQRARMVTWVQQVQAATPDGQLSAVMWRPDGGDWMVAMPVEDWATLAREAIDTVETKTASLPDKAAPAHRRRR